jgi:hypothetical protein
MNLKQLLAIATLVASGSSAHAVIQLGNPYTPAGANFQITAVQGIDASNPLGKTGFSPQVNHDFEFQGSIIHYNGTSWTTVSNDPTLSTINGMWGTSSSDIWIVGNYGTLRHGPPTG